jgi:hypothetical protein
MKRVSFTKYTVFLLVCFFSLIFTSKAAYDVEDTINVRLPYGSTYSIDGASYENFNCKTESLSALKATLTNKVYTISLKQVMEKEGTLIITADHGNCDTMWDKDKVLVTSHTSEKVPFIVTKENITLKDGSLSDIAPTMLYLLDLDKPEEMTGENLIET